MKLQPHHHKYKNIFLFLIGLTTAFLFSRWPIFNQLLIHHNNFDYFSAFIAGALFVSTFTIATGGLILLDLSKTISPVILIAIACSGAVIFDYLIFKFVKDKVDDDIIPVFDKFLERHHLHKILHTRYFAWTLPVIGVFIIISPLPDELGISLLGLSKMNPSRFIVISLISHIIGMSSIVTASRLI